MDQQLIQFHALEKDWIPAPIPAIQALPDWYKNLAGKVSAPDAGGTLHTVKHCPPFLDAMTAGYIIPLCGDVDFTLDAGGQLTFDCPGGDTTVEMHHPAQAAGAPWGDAPVIKFMNPWIIVTPPGYSTLFVPPLNQEPIPFRILAGVVDTDVFYSQVNLPAVCLMSRGSTCRLRRATPLVQVIPFKREAWRAQSGHADARQCGQLNRDISHSHHVYREQFHQKKSFD
jgi:hypothetical protein